jgi:hypothetical protein
MVGRIRALSAAEPIARAGVMAANMHWNTQNTKSGTLLLAIDGPPRTPRRNALSKLPMNRLAPRLKVNE